MISSPPFVGIDPAHWLQAAWLAAGDSLPRLLPDGARGAVRLLTDGGRVVRADHTRHGPIAAPSDSSDLAGVAAAHDAAAAVAFTTDLPERLVRRAAAAMHPGMDVTGQALACYEAARSEWGEGVRVWPAQEPKPPTRLGGLNLALKTALPAGQLLVAVVYSEDGAVRDGSGQPIVTSTILRFNALPGLDLCATTGALPGIAIHDWRKDWRQVNDAARAAFGKIFVAIHLPDAVLPELFSADRAGRGPAALLDLHRRGRIVLDPFPLRLRMIIKVGKFF